MDQPHYLDSLAIRSRTAIVMPQWFPPEITADAVVDVLTTNLADVDAYAAPANVCLVVDACPAAETAVAAVNQDRTSAGLEPFVVAINGENLGQGGSLVRGYRVLLDRGCECDWFVTRDADGDHFINDLPHLARLAAQIASTAAASCYMVIGRRIDVRRPMTWFRGELEQLVNRAMMDALAYRLAQRGRVIDQRFMHPNAAWPDTQSGYKLYSLDLVRRVIDEYRGLADPPWGPDTFRYVGQVAPFLICLDADGVCGEVIRSSLTDQTASSFGPETFRRQYRAKLHYILRRCELAGAAARQILANAIIRSDLWIHPEGKALCGWLWNDLAGELDLGPVDALTEPTFR